MMTSKWRQIACLDYGKKYPRSTSLTKLSAGKRPIMHLKVSKKSGIGRSAPWAGK